MKKTKILFLIPSLEHGGAEKVLVNLVNNIDKSKFDVTVQTLFDVGVNKQYLKKEVVYKTCFTHYFRGNSRIIKHIPAKILYKRLVKEQYDIVISYLEGPTTRIISGCPYDSSAKVCWFHIELDSEKKYSLCFSSHKAATNAYLGFDKIICVSQTVKEALEKTAGIAFPQCDVLYNTNESSKIRRMATEEITDVVFDKNIVNVCSVAKITPSKGFDRLARVHKKLLEEGYFHRIYLLGIGEQQLELEHYLKENKLENNFIFLGFRDNPYKYMAACDLYVCSSRREGFSTAVTESLIVGTPVVSTCCSGAYELLGYNNEFGIVTENSEEGIYQGMKQMISDEYLRKRYAIAAAERGQLFQTENTVKAVEQMLLSILA